MNKLLKNLSVGVCLLLLASSLAFAKTHRILLVVDPGCGYCTEAKNILNSSGIKYSTTNGKGPVPRLYVDGKYQGTGVDAVRDFVGANGNR